MSTKIDKNSTQKTTAVKLLQDIVNDSNMAKQLRMEAAKALLPYTAKKMPETLETFNTNRTVSDERLAALSNDDLAKLIELVEKVTSIGGDGEGAEEAETQLDS